MGDDKTARRDGGGHRGEAGGHRGPPLPGGDRADTGEKRADTEVRPYGGGERADTGEKGHNSVVHRVSPFWRFARLSFADQAATLEALAAVAAARVLLITMPQARLSQWLKLSLSGAPPASARDSEATAISVQRVRTAVGRASARVPGATCLVQAMAGWWMLKNRAIGAQIRIGVDKVEQDFSAHAWLVVGDVIVLGGKDAAARFVTLKSR